MFFEIIVLDCIDKLKNERTISAIYHLFNGKRSSQTLQDAHMYDLTAYFGIYKSLQRENFNQITNQMVDRGLIQINDYGVASVTEMGYSCYKKGLEQVDPGILKGLQYEKLTQAFSERLLLFIQTFTNIESGNYSFLSIIDDKTVQYWVKRMYSKHKGHTQQSIKYLYQELFEMLSGLKEIEASIFVSRLTGYNKIGLSKEQIAKKYHLDYYDVEIYLVYVHHYLIQFIINNKQLFLYSFIADLVGQLFLTDSAEQTLRLYKRGYDINQIARMRRLKGSTIQDHLIEIAYNDPDFTIDQFISTTGVSEIMGVVQKLGTNKLKAIKVALHDKYSYFQIRLVLATSQFYQNEGSAVND